MGIDATLEEEWGDILKSANDPYSSFFATVVYFYHFWPDPARYVMIRCIDECGLTLFNSRQCWLLQHEFAELLNETWIDIDEAIIGPIADLVRECAESYSLYVRFTGD